MPEYHVTDPDTGRSVTLTGESAPTEAELEQIFKSLPKAPKAQAGPSKETLGRPVSAEDFTDKPAAGRGIGGFFSDLAHNLNPMPMVQAVVDLQRGTLGGDMEAAQRTADRVKGIVGAQGEQFKKTGQAAAQGRYSEALGHLGAGMLPLVGPAAANAGEQIASGDIAGGLGATTALLAPPALKYGLEAKLVGSLKTTPAAVEAATKAREASRAATAAQAATPTDAEAAFAERYDIPRDVAQATNSRVVKAVQHVADRSLGGNFVAERAIAKQQGRLATVGEQLASKAHAAPQDAASAGSAAQQAVGDIVHAKNAEATSHYETLRKIEADPKHTQRVQVGTRTEEVPASTMLDASGQPMSPAGTRTVPIMEDVPMPVNIATAKEAFRGAYDALKREAELAPASIMGDKARALTAMDRLLQAPDNAPLSTVDAVLGDLKKFARADNPDLRTMGQGQIAEVVKALETEVRATAMKAGPEALKALEAGRKATVEKYAAADVLDALNRGAEEPVKAFARLTANHDTSIEHLRDVVAQAPEVGPKIGRAVLDDLLGTATQDGGFTHTAKVAAEWEKLGDATKRVLFPDPSHLHDLNSFFKLAKKTAENSNPSGTAHVLLVAGQGGLLWSNPLAGATVAVGSAALSKFLHSQAGVRLVTKGLRMPSTSPAAAASYAAELSRFASRAKIPMGAPATAADSQPGQAPATAQR